jgi:hypothetical protein
MSTPPGDERLAKFLDAVEKLPPYGGLTFRGCAAGSEHVRPGQSVVTQRVVSTSLDPDVASEGRTAPALYAIRSLRGRSIAPFSARQDEQEVVFLPGTLFHLAETKRFGSVPIHLVFELTLDEGPPRLSEEDVSAAARSAASALRRRWDSAPAEFTSLVGKFSGDLE